MIKKDRLIREELSADAQKFFDDIYQQKVLGASSHIKMISEMILDLCDTAQLHNTSTITLNLKIHRLTDFFIKTRGEASQAITNAINILLKEVNDQTKNDLDTYINHIRQNISDFKKINDHNLDLVNQYAQSVLSNMKSILLFDYSSTVGRMVETCEHSLRIFIAESRSFEGGKPYIQKALKGNHSVHFIPDAAIYHYLKGCDGVFIGSETHYADGKVFNTIGTEMVAVLCQLLNVPFYVLTTLIKTDYRAVYGHIKKPLLLNLRNKVLPDFSDDIKDKIDFSCPEIVGIPAKHITAFVTEKGIVPPSAMFLLCSEYIEKLGMDINHD